MIEGIATNFIASSDVLALNSIPLDLKNFKGSVSFWYKPQKQNLSSNFTNTNSIYTSVDLVYSFTNLSTSGGWNYNTIIYQNWNDDDPDYIIFDMGLGKKYLYFL